MEQDFLKELKYLGVTARIKRLSDSLFYSIKELYKAQNFCIEPSWHLIFLKLKEHEQLTMMEIATVLQLSKPAITKMIRKMYEMGYVHVYPDPNDNRKKIVKLTPKAKEELPAFERVWEAGQKTVEQMLATNPHFMQALEDFEKQQSVMSFHQRALKNLSK